MAAMDRTVDAHVKTLRAKLHAASPDTDPIVTHRGLGYSLEGGNVSLRVRLLVLILSVYCIGGYFLTRRALDQVRPRYLESMEETLVDTSVLLASVLETQLVGDTLDAGGMQRALGAAQQRRFEAKIFSLRKTTLDMRVYVTDAKGGVVFDSTSRDVGRDYSNWNDVKRDAAW